MKERRDIFPNIGRGDLVRTGLDPQLAALLGYEHDPHRRARIDTEHRSDQEIVPGFFSKRPGGMPSPVQPGPLTPVQFLIPVQFSVRTVRNEDSKGGSFNDASPIWENRPTQPPGHIPLADDARTKSLFDHFAPGRRETRAPDVDAVINQVVKARPLKRMPRKSYKAARHMQIVADRSTRLAPFWVDQRLAMLAAPKSSVFWVFEEAEGRFRKIGQKRYSVPDPEDGPIIVLGDLGAFGGERARALWQRIGEDFSLGEEDACAILPCAADDVPLHLLDLWKVQPWEQTFGPTHADKRESDVERLLMLASYAARLEPGLLRALRRELTEAEAVTELLLYNASAVASPSAEAATLDPQRIGAYRREFEQFARENPDQARKAWAILRQWRQPIGDEFMFEELMSLPPDLRKLLPEEKGDVAHAEAFWCSMRDAGQAGLLSDTAAVWLRSAARRRVGDPTGLFSYAPANEVLQLAVRRQNGGPLADQELTVSLRGSQLCFGASKGSLLGVLRTGDGEVIVQQALPSFRDQMKDGSEGPEMIEVPAGTFMMGSPEDEDQRWKDEGPLQAITFEEPFALARYPVTFDEYDAFCEATQREKPHDRGWGRGRRPVINVSLNDAKAYCDWLSAETGEPYHLPSEAAWEYACRAGTKTRYHWGNEWTPDRANGGGSLKMTTSVGSYDPNGWGFYDMLGNVEEWCEDIWSNSHDGAAADGSARQASQQDGQRNRVLRGGSWIKDAGACRSASRERDAPGHRSVHIGFRPALGQKGAQAGSQSADRAGLGGRKASRAEPTAGRRQSPAGGANPLARLRVTPTIDASLDLRSLRDIPPDAPFVIRTDRADLVIQRMTRSDLKWASGLGRDHFGLWAEITVDDLRPRLRYCPPGRFEMGSPKGEPGRFENERSQTEVKIQTGFWLFETPVTQALYQAVLPGLRNPSRFQSPLRPVEQVSWHETHDFLAALNDRTEGLNLHLPSEAAWEYACRAGTTEAIYAGPLELLGERNAPALNDIAWYGGNSGVNFDLDDGHDSSSWPNKQYDHDRAGTRIVAQKKANQWGLYDMLGNVMEWCQDTWDDNHEGAADFFARQASQKNGGSERVLRGGSWRDGASRCRSAFRSRVARDSRNDNVGFRPARGQQGAQATKSESAERSGPDSVEVRRAEATAERGPSYSGVDISKLPDRYKRWLY